MKYGRPVTERFWERVACGLHPDACWIWLAGTDRDGYGKLARSLYAHRVSWSLHNGPVPEGLCVLHTCDNPPCTNPAHLALGTKWNNNWDRALKGRSNPPNRGQRLTHCKRGLHEMTPDNTYVNTNRRHVLRACRQCMRESRLINCVQRLARQPQMRAVGR